MQQIVTNVIPWHDIQFIVTLLEQIDQSLYFVILYCHEEYILILFWLELHVSTKLL